MRVSLFSLMLLVFCHQQSAIAFDGPRQSTKVPRFDAAVEKGLSFLRAEVQKEKPEHGYLILAAYAMVKSGVPKDDHFVQEAVAESLQRSQGGQYRPISPYDHIYGSGVDAMLLSAVDAEGYMSNLQAIAYYVESVQRSDGSWSDGPASDGDISMSQYGILALWACQRAGCTISPAVLDRAADYLMKKGSADGGWAYRPGTTNGAEGGGPSHNMTVAGAGALGICRLLLHGLRNPPEPEKKEEELVFGALQKLDPLAEAEKQKLGPAFKGYNPQYSASELDARVDRALSWNSAHFTPVGKGGHNLYYFYCLERAAAVGDLGNVNGQDWFTIYGDGLLSLQGPEGGWETYKGTIPGTSFALLYYMRSTDQDIKKMYGLGLQLAARGNPFGEKKQKDPTELDRLIGDIANMDFDKLDESEVADDVVQSVLAIDNPEDLVGQEDQLKTLMNNPNAKVRSAAVWALGRTGDFKLVPLLLDGIRDNSVDVNIEAIQALRFIARKPQGFGETLAPFASLGTDVQIAKATPEERLKLATPWRDKALRDWSNWYFSVRPFEDRGGIEELQLAVPQKAGSADVGEPAKK